MLLLTPQQIEKAAEDIVDFWSSSELPEKDKTKILEMVTEYYETKNEHLHDQYFAGLARRTLQRHSPETGFENGD